MSNLEVPKGPIQSQHFVGSKLGSDLSGSIHKT